MKKLVDTNLNFCNDSKLIDSQFMALALKKFGVERCTYFNFLSGTTFDKNINDFREIGVFIKTTNFNRACVILSEYFDKGIHKDYILFVDQLS